MTHLERRGLCGVLGGLALASLGGAAAMAGSQPSNSSPDCSNGHCMRLDTTVIEDDRGGARGWRRVEAWDERSGRARRTGRSARSDDDDRFGPPRGRDDD